MSGQLDYPILGAPTLSKSAFANILRAAHSPAAGEAGAIYDAFASRGVNPAIGLAISLHESNFGKAGIAVGRKNLFGDRYYAGAAKFGAVNARGWAKFPTYAAGAAYEASLLAGPSYGGSSHYGTARTFPFRYAPTSDGNSPRRYGDTIVSLVHRWSGPGGTIAYHPARVTSTAHHAATTKHPAGSAHAKPHPATLNSVVRAHPKGAAVGGGIGAAIVLLLII